LPGSTSGRGDLRHRHGDLHGDVGARSIIGWDADDRRFVLINALLMQLAQPLNFIGFIYREIVQGLADIEAMFQAIGRAAARCRYGPARRRRRERAVIRFDDVHFSYEPTRRS
jgi:ATP-binding cassette subfamily B protein